MSELTTPYLYVILIIDNYTYYSSEREDDKISMKKNLRSLIENIAPGNSACLVDMNQYDMIEGSGMTPDLAHKKSAHMSAAWNVLRDSHVSIPMGGSDLSGYRYLTFSLYSMGAMGVSFRLLFDSSMRGEGKNGYATTVEVTRDGWNDYRIELPFMHTVREAAGWNNIGSITMEYLTGIPEGARRCVICFDSFYIWDTYAAPLYTKMPELKGAALFSRTGGFSIVDRKRIPNAIDGATAKPFEEKGILWLPMAPVAAGIAHLPIVDNRAGTLSFTYRRKKYVFTAGESAFTVDGESAKLPFRPILKEGTLFFPAEYVREFFRWRQIYTDQMGLIVLSNRRNIFLPGRDDKAVWQLIADMTFLRPDGDRILNDLHRRFPNPTRGRLLFSYEELMQLRREAKEEPTLKEYVNALKSQYGTGSVAYKSLPISALLPREGQMLTDDLSASADQILGFSTLYRVTGDKKYCERAAAECMALAEFTDWGSNTMSTVGTVALSVAVCYDWCHHMWSESRKAVVERALLRNAMRPGLECYDGKRRMWIEGGTAAAVINAGMLATALALADIYPETSHKLLDRILRNTEPCFASYAPDGGYAEGITAWEKSFRSLSLIIAMLEKACGTDYGFFSAPGFAASAYFPTSVETANGAWNYHNSTATPTDTAMMSWMSKKTEDPIPAWLRRQHLVSGRKTVHPFDILFYTPTDADLKPRLPMDAVYRKAGLAAMRSGWGREDLFVGLHGGNNAEVNGDLDAGSILLDAGGVRFFCEIGGRSELPVMLRRRAIGQNTLIINPCEEPTPDQNPDAKAPIVEMRGSADRVYAVVDMSKTNDAVLRAKRGVMLTDHRNTAVIQDEVVLNAPGKIVWNAYTPAAVTLSGGNKIAKLEKDGKILLCKLGGLGGAKFSVESVEGTELCRLYIEADVKARFRLSVAASLISLEEPTSKKLYDPVPISAWGE